MQAAVLYEPHTPLKLEEFELPDLGPRHVLVRLVASGVCHSDWHVIKGEWPHIPIPSILGHKGAGVVEEVGGAVKGHRGRRPTWCSRRSATAASARCATRATRTSATRCPARPPSRASPAAGAGCASSSGSAPSARRPWCLTTW